MKAKIIHKTLTHQIRKEVLWPHIKNDNYAIPVDNHPTTFHLGTFVKKNLISIGTFVEEKNPKINANTQYRLRAMATDKNYQQKGAGKCLFLKGVEILKNKNIELLWCDARINAVPFYESLDMNSLIGFYEIENIGLHKTMYLELNKTQT